MRFLAEDVLAGVHGGLEEHGVEVRRAGDRHHVHVAVDHFVIGVEADEAMGVVDGHLVGIHFFQPRAAVFNAFGKHVGHGYQAHVFAGVHGVGGRAAAPAAAADQAHLDHVAAGGVDAAGQRHGTVGRRT